MSDKRYAILFEYDNVLDLDPFPCIPAGALWSGDMYLVAGALDAFADVGVNDVMVMTSSGTVYLTEAIGSYEDYNSMSITHYSDLDERGSVAMLNLILATAIHETNHPIMFMPGNVLTELHLSDVEAEHLAHKRPAATVVLVPGENNTDLNLPPGYKLTNIMLLEKKAGSILDKMKKVSRLVDFLKELERKNEVMYYTFDGFLFEVESPEHFAMLRPPS